MTAKELKKKYIDFFVKRGHKLLPNVSLIPENDPTALFINSGMHPLVPYLLGEPHPLGKRLVSNQRCLRTQDIDEVGDVTHNTFFEMLGNWSLGGYWKKEAISWSWEFLIAELNFDPKRISVTCFAGDKDAPRDEETAKIWQSLGIPKGRIYFLGKKDNWWSVGETGPCGPDTEMFYDTRKKKCGPDCRPGCNCGKYFEVWNDVFIQFNKLKNGKLERLKQLNIDTGMGVERTVAMLQGKDDIYQTELFRTLINQIEQISSKTYQEENKKPMRIIADHLRAATFIIADRVVPSNVEQGYVLRRLIRRAIRYGRMFQLIKPFIEDIAQRVINDYKDEYPHLLENEKEIFQELEIEEKRFRKTLERGIKEFQKTVEPLIKQKRDKHLPFLPIPGIFAFHLYDTYGFPPELTDEMAKETGLSGINWDEYHEAFKKHQEISRAGLEKKFAGGLVDHSEEVTKLHTVTHLLHQALRDVLGSHVQQVGSNITPQRLRFDFTHPEKLTNGQIGKIEKIVNQKIKENLPVKMEMMSLTEAKKKCALAFFGKRYGERVKVYSIGPSTSSGRPYSIEVCGGPHVSFTGRIGRVKIIKEESIGAGRRRIYAELVPKP